MELERLPPEVIEIIIDLARDNKKFLRTCALVARNWVQASRYHLFETVELNSGTVLGFLDIASHPNPTFLHHIQRLKFRHGDPGQYEDLAVQQIWTQVVVRLPNIPLSSVKSLHLSDSHWQGLYTEPASSTFHAITELHLSNTYFEPPPAFFDLVSRFSGLENLCIDESGYDSDEELTTEQVVQYSAPKGLQTLRLQELKLSFRTSLYRWLLVDPILTEFVVNDLEAEELEILVPRFAKLADTLQVLDLAFFDNETYLRDLAPDDLHELTDLSKFHNLRSLRFHAIDTDEPAALAQRVYDCLGSIRSPLQHLTLVVDVPWPSPVEWKDFARWDHLVEILSSPYYANLKDLNLEWIRVNELEDIKERFPSERLGPFASILHFITPL